ncbi:anti-sigma factor [Phycicoccus sp. Root563]|uniref:anti-sigma factor family protein n=1 Tax=Phycicoccus sp. Root563 TaxID=1736562 RepID=UPI00138F2DBC|nr:zf-HC2 domain-containing protein [Phycicoccus sp. Root563]
MRELLGPYVLGGLDAADRALLDGHLSTCPTCRNEVAAYAGLPSLLRLGHGPNSSTTAELDDGALTRAVGALRQGRRRRRRRSLLGSAAAAVLVLGLGATTAGLVAGHRDTPQTNPAALHLVAVQGSPARGQTSLSARPWGTSIDLDLSALPKDQRFIVWVIATDGTREQAATWASTPDGIAHVTGASALARTDVAAVRVATTDGTLLLSTDI